MNSNHQEKILQLEEKQKWMFMSSEIERLESMIIDKKNKQASKDDDNDEASESEDFITMQKSWEEFQALNHSLFSQQCNAYGKLTQTFQKYLRHHGGIVELEKKLSISSDESYALKMKIDEMEKCMEEKQQELKDLAESFNQTIMTMERKNNHENQDARKELIKSMQGMHGCVDIGIKRLGELELAPFSAVVKKRKCSGSAPPVAGLDSDSSVEAQLLCSLWEKHLADPGWHPFKMVAVGDKNQEIIDEEDPKLKGLKSELGEDAYKAVTTSLVELNEHNPSGRCPISEIWNFKEGRKASLKEGYSVVLEKLKVVGKNNSVVSSPNITTLRGFNLAVKREKRKMNPTTVIQESIVEKKETEELSPKATEQAEEASRKRKNLPSENQVESKRNKRNDQIGEDEKIEEDKEENKKMRYTSTSSNETMNRLHQFCRLPEFVSVKQVIDAHTPFVGLMEKKLPSKLTQQVLATVMQKWKDGFYEHEPGTKYELGADLARKEFGIVEGGADAMELQISESYQRTSLVHKALRWTKGINNFDIKTLKKSVFVFFEDWKSESGTKPEPEVLARLYFALSFCEFFFSEAHRVNDAYFHLLDDLKNLKRYRWDKAIVAFLTKGMDLAYTKTQKKQDRSDTQINGCAFLIEKFLEENNIPLIKRDKKVAEVRNAEVRNQPRKDKKVAK